MKKIIPVLIILVILIFSCSTLEVDNNSIEEAEPTVIVNKENTKLDVPVVNKEDSVAVEEKNVQETVAIIPPETEEPNSDIDAIPATVVDVDDISIEEPVEVMEITEPMATVENITPVATEEKKEDERIEPISSAIASEDSVSIAKLAEPTAIAVTQTNLPKPVLDNDISPTVLQLFAVIIVITVVYTISVAIRGANKMPLGRVLSLILSLLFTALPIIISTIVTGWTLVWLLYLVLLFSYFIFRSSWKSSSFI